MIESYRKAQENPNVDARKTIIKYLQDDLGLARLRDKRLMLFVLLSTIIPQGIKE